MKKHDFIIGICKKSILDAAKRHDVGHLAALGPKNNGLSEDYALEDKLLSAVYRYETFKRELNALSAALNAAQIPFMPLKGSVIRQYYPEPWMRTNCDIDILVHASDLDRATECLERKLSYEFKGRGSHDALLVSKSGKHIELNYALSEGNDAAAQVLKSVWGNACNTGEFRYDMADEMLYFYHIAHMAKHFENGGCGIRPFIDIWALNHRAEFDKSTRKALLKKGGLNTFAAQAELLSESTEQTEDYILRGGVYGTNTNRVAVQQ